MVIELLTAILALITGFYAWITFQIFRANESVVDVMREQALATSRPNITVTPFLELDNYLLPSSPIQGGQQRQISDLLSINRFSNLEMKSKPTISHCI